MKYRYLYQTRENENREGEIVARNREAAYVALRKQGIRPYRIIGDDPWNWRPWAAGAVVVSLLAALAWNLLKDKGDDRTPRLRQQIVGDAEIIARGVASDWEDQLATRLDRYLSAYAQPGGSAVPPFIEPDELESLKADLKSPIAYMDGERSEYRQLKNIVAYLREEMRTAMDAGDSVSNHFAFLESRQREEIALRHRAEESVEKAPESYRDKVAASVNVRLRARGIAPVR